MKTLAQNLKQAFDALEFTNANHLNALNAKLNPETQRTTSVQAELRTERHNRAHEHILGAAVASH
jgi:hypothetical protein